MFELLGRRRQSSGPWQSKTSLIGPNLLLFVSQAACSHVWQHAVNEIALVPLRSTLPDAPFSP